MRAAGKKHEILACTLHISGLPAWMQRKDGTAAGGTKVFVMIRCPSMTEAPPGFVPKRGFQFNSKRGLQVCWPLTCQLFANILGRCL